MSNGDNKDLTGDLSDREILLALRQGLLDLTGEVRDLKGQVSDLKGQVSESNERVTRLENRTNPLPPNYEERFAALEEQVARIPAIELILEGMREDLERERQGRLTIQRRVKALETKAA